MNSSTEQNQQLDKFIHWFRDLDPRDQDELMTLVYSEHKQTWCSFSSMPDQQGRLSTTGTSKYLLNRISTVCK